VATPLDGTRVYQAEDRCDDIDVRDGDVAAWSAEPRVKQEVKIILTATATTTDARMSFFSAFWSYIIGTFRNTATIV